jgi:hypothetical protein
LHPVECVIVVDGGGSWSQGVSSRRWRGFGVGMVILAHLLFLIRVAKDNDIAVIGRPEKPMVGVAEELSGDLLIS